MSNFPQGPYKFNRSAEQKARILAKIEINTSPEKVKWVEQLESCLLQFIELSESGNFGKCRLEKVRENGVLLAKITLEKDEILIEIKLEKGYFLAISSTNGEEIFDVSFIGNGLGTHISQLNKVLKTLNIDFEFPENPNF